MTPSILKENFEWWIGLHHHMVTFEHLKSLKPLQCIVLFYKQIVVLEDCGKGILEKIHEGTQDNS
jgi:hypothetical protein